MCSQTELHTVTVRETVKMSERALGRTDLKY